MINVEVNYSILFKNRDGDIITLPMANLEDYRIVDAKVKRDPDKYNEHYYWILLIGVNNVESCFVDDDTFNGLLEYVSISPIAFE